MMLALYIFLAIVAAGVVLRLTDRPDKPSEDPDGEPEAEGTPAEQEECCGMHITCERDSLLAGVSDRIEYYDDEELDAYRGRRPDDYSDEEIEQFRDVLLTLRPEEIAGWGRSIQLRGIELPGCVRDELLMIVAEARASHA